MAIALVPKYVRALSEQINAYYRLLTGADPASVDLRLNGGGRFAVHHSGTNAVVFQVNDAGATGVYQPGDITDPDIADQTIVNRHVNNAAAIAVTKIAHVGANNVLKSNGSQNIGAPLVAADIPNDSITSAKIVDDSIVNGDIKSDAAIAITKIAHVGVNNVLRGGAAGTANQAGQVLNTDLAGSIAITKLVDVGANNLLRSDGAGNVAGKLQTNDVTINTLNGDRIQSNTMPPAKITNVTAGHVLRDVGSGVVGGGFIRNANIDVAGAANIDPNKLAPVTAGHVLRDVGAGLIGGGFIRNANIDAAGTADIAINKLLHIGAGNVIKSDGSQNIAGKIVSADITDGTIMDLDINAAADINGSKLKDNSVPAIKLSGAVPPPAGTGVADAWKAYGTDAAGTTVALRQVATEMLVADAVLRRVTCAPSGSVGLVASWALIATSGMNITTQGYPVKLEWSLAVNSSAVTSISIGYTLDGGAVNQVALHNYPAAGGWSTISGHYWIAMSGTPTVPVSHGVTLAWQSGVATTGTLNVATATLTEYRKST